MYSTAVQHWCHRRPDICAEFMPFVIRPDQPTTNQTCTQVYWLHRCFRVLMCSIRNDISGLVCQLIGLQASEVRSPAFSLFWVFYSLSQCHSSEHKTIVVKEMLCKRSLLSRQLQKGFCVNTLHTSYSYAAVGLESWAFKKSVS